MVLDSARGGLWLHGGFRANYPYLSTNGAGVEAGTAKDRSTRKSYMPFSGHNIYYYDDLWFFNMSTNLSIWDRQGPGRGQSVFAMRFQYGTWDQIRPQSLDRPLPRVEHTMILSRNVLMVVGGYYNNHYYNETWLFNISAYHWLKKERFVHARYPENCTNDIKFINDHAECFALHWPRDLQRDEFRPFTVLSMQQQAWYSPLPNQELYYGIVDMGKRVVQGSSSAVKGEPLVPAAKTGPQQYVRNVTRQTFIIGANESHNGTVYEW